MSKPTYDSTVARIAGNILSARPFTPWTDMSGDVVLTDADMNAMQWAVLMARAIVSEVQRTESQELDDARAALAGGEGTHD